VVDGLFEFIMINLSQISKIANSFVELFYWSIMN